MDWQKTKYYWTAKGVIPRWQITLAYVFIAFAFAISVSGLHQDNEATQAVLTRECIDTNHRNKATKATLIAAAKKDIAKAEQNARDRKLNPELFRNEIEGRRDVTLALIDALVPVRDCKNLVP